MASSTGINPFLLELVIQELISDQNLTELKEFREISASWNKIILNKISKTPLNLIDLRKMTQESIESFAQSITKPALFREFKLQLSQYPHLVEIGFFSKFAISKLEIQVVKFQNLQGVQQLLNCVSQSLQKLHISIGFKRNSQAFSPISVEDSSKFQAGFPLLEKISLDFWSEIDLELLQWILPLSPKFSTFSMRKLPINKSIFNAIFKPGQIKALKIKTDLDKIDLGYLLTLSGGGGVFSGLRKLSCIIDHLLDGVSALYFQILERNSATIEELKIRVGCNDRHHEESHRIMLPNLPTCKKLKICVWAESVMPFDLSEKFPNLEELEIYHFYSWIRKPSFCSKPIETLKRIVLNPWCNPFGAIPLTWSEIERWAPNLTSLQIPGFRWSVETTLDLPRLKDLEIGIWSCHLDMRNFPELDTLKINLGPRQKLTDQISEEINQYLVDTIRNSSASNIIIEGFESYKPGFDEDRLYAIFPLRSLTFIPFIEVYRKIF